ncbi:MAG: YncE family protein [candidate division WOR-3 bacterium]|nr:MAG: YncE family protein [candidate division WOR-3 bacterium]
MRRPLLIPAAAVFLVVCHSNINNPPDPPGRPASPATGRADSSYTFTTTATDPDGDLVCVRFDWGDGDTSGWSDFVLNGDTVAAQHMLPAGLFAVRAQARDASDALSDWSPPCSVAVSPWPRFPDSVVASVRVGADPVGIDVLPDGSLLYVACEDDSTVYVIDTRTFEATAVIQVSGWPAGVAALPNGDYVYVTNQDSSVYVIRTSDNSVVDEIPVGSGPWDVAAHPSGEWVYVSNYDTSTVSVIRTSDNAVIATIQVGYGPMGLAVSTDGQRVYVANEMDYIVSVISTSSNTVEGTIILGEGPIDVAVLPAGDRIYVSSEEWLEGGGMDDHFAVFVAEPGGNRASDTVAVADGEPYGVAALPNGAYVYALCDASEYLTVQVISTATNRVVAFLDDYEDTGLGPYGIVCPDDSTVYIADYYKNTVTAMGLSKGGTRCLSRVHGTEMRSDR